MRTANEPNGFITDPEQNGPCFRKHGEENVFKSQQCHLG